MNTPKEFFINFGDSTGTRVRTPEQFFDDTFPKCQDYQDEAVRVIEYSAYENLLQRYQVLDRVNDDDAITIKRLDEKVRDLKIKIQELEAELKGDAIDWKNL